MKLTAILATRNRPHLLIPTIRKTVENIALPDTEIVICVDKDDTATISELSKTEFPLCVDISVAERELSFGEKYNRGLKIAPADVYLAMVDYAPHVTPGFDQKILDAASIYPDGYAVVYNRNANLSFPGINAVTHKLAERLGGLFPPLYPYWFVDHHLDDIAQMIGRIVFADVVIDTSARDDRPDKPWTQGQRETWFWALLFDVLAAERQALARDIIADIEDTNARKTALRNNIPMIAHHSMMVNSQARQMLGSDHTEDDWYRAVKKNGMDKFASVLTAEGFRNLLAMQEQADRQRKMAMAA